MNWTVVVRMGPAIIGLVFFLWILWKIANIINTPTQHYDDDDWMDI